MITSSIIGLFSEAVIDGASLMVTFSRPSRAPFTSESKLTSCNKQSLSETKPCICVHGIVGHEFKDIMQFEIFCSTVLIGKENV